MSKHQIKPVDQQPDFPTLEKELLDHWYSSGIVDKYLHKNDHSDKKFSFQDGPITANNPMGVHHAWGRTYKDLWQRYKNMRGFAQRFQNGFDCQGLWVEVEVEKELGFKSKKDIESYGVAKFVELCKDRVKKFSDIQTQQSRRLGYFMDWNNSYFTMSPENNYTIWHFLKVCYEKDWIYKGHESVPWCPRCETAISQHEMLTEDYKELTHDSVYLKLPILSEGYSKKEYLLVWTTTPWTIPANIAVAVDKNKMYTQYPLSNEQKEFVWVMSDSVDRLVAEGILPISTATIMDTKTGAELVNAKYAGPFDEIVTEKVQGGLNNFHIVVATDDQIMPISSTEGTGLIHTAVSAGTEDFQLGRKLSLPMIPVIADNADYLPGLGFLSGQNAKKHPEIIIDFLKTHEGGRFFLKTIHYTHRYPACWRCKTELVWKVADEWYICMDKKDPEDKEGRTLREKMIDVAKKISWKPEFGLDRELDWLNNMHDWLISKKNRYWGLALPIWTCKSCKKFEVIGGVDELQSRAISGWDKFGGHTPHKPFIDEVKIKCSCGGEMSRIPDVGNPWLDAGIVSFSTLIDPETKKVSYLTDKKYWQKWFPADFITESFPGQFKNWFYAMIAMSTVLEDTNPFRHVLGFASMFGEDGRAMHKSWGNSIEFNEGADKIGVDVMRWAFVRHNPERNLLFGYKTTGEVKRQFHMILWNSYRFFTNLVSLDDWSPVIGHSSINHLDLWILARLNQVISEVTINLDSFDAFSATNVIEKFVQDFSTWYIRRSRDRVGPSAEDLSDKNSCYQTFYQVLEFLSRIMMPFTPFISDVIYTNLTGEESVHLANWPEYHLTSTDEQKLIEQMQLVRDICELGHSKRKLENIAVKQALSSIKVFGNFDTLADSPQLLALICEELNVENIIFEKSDTEKVEYDLEITQDLKDKGKMRELIRQIQGARKEAGCRLDEWIKVELPDWPINFESDIKRKVLANELTKSTTFKIIRSN